MPQLPETAWFELGPDWICEVLSPSTAKTDRSLKLPPYTKHAVRHTWIVDPALRSPEVYQLSAGKWLLLTSLKEDDPVRLPPFDAITFSLDLIWA